MLYLPITVSIFSLVFAYFLIREVRKAPSGSGKQTEISQAIREGVTVFLKRQYKTISIFALFLFFILWLTLGLKTAFGFLVGAFFSALAGFIGMMISTQANLKVDQAAKSGLKEAFNLSFKGGSVTGFLVVGLALFSISGFYFLTQDLRALIALGFGASLISLFARLGGEIYTKAADVGADLVGKIEKGIPENDPRNPAVIVDQVGDNVGYCAGIAADLFETYLVTIVAAMVLGALIFPGQIMAVILPLYLAAIAILASIISTYFVKLKKTENPTWTIFRGLIIAGILSAIGFWAIISQSAVVLKLTSINLYLPTVIGLLIVGGMFLITDFFTSKKFWQVKSITRASQSDYRPNIVIGLAGRMKSTIWPVILISISILISFSLGGMYGLSIAVTAMLSLTGLIIALDSYCPITDNALGISEMIGLPEEVRKNTDALDVVGNTTKATTKGYAIASAGLAALVLFSVYTQELLDLGLRVQFILEDPKVLVGLFFGGIIVYYFAFLAISAIGMAASKVVEEARRQFREIKGLVEGKANPEYGKCVDIVTKASLKGMVLPSLLPVFSPILVGFILGPKALGGLLIGAIIVGIFLAISMTSSGVVWDNTKKWIEEGNLGWKGFFNYQTAVTGDTGDFAKDTSGSAINPMIKVLNIVALLIVSFLV